MRLSLGFPPGYGPNDEGVTFQAYHFKRDAYGEIIGLEEIPCIVTRYGLIIQCTSFSPFAVVAVPDNGAAKTSKSIVLSTSQGGRILGDGQSIFTLGEGQEKQLTIQADNGYVIDAVVVGGKYQKVTGNKSMEVTARYKDLADGDIIEAQFVAETVRQQEAARGEAVVQPAPRPAQVSLGQGNITVKEKEGFEITTTVQAADGITTYQWYKDGTELPGKIGPKLTVPSASAQDAGKYTVVVTTSSGIASTDAASGACVVNVVSQAPGNTPKPASPKPNLKKVTGLKASSSKTDRVKLQWGKAANAGGYQILRYNMSLKKFVKVANVSGTSYTDRRKTAGKPYRYKVRAYKKANGKTYYGSLSKEAKVIVKPKAPTGISAKRLSATSVQISFQPVKNVNSYRIYKYKKGSSKQQASFKVTSKKFYKYNKKTKKWVYQGKTKKAKNGRITCKLAGFPKTDRNQRYRIKAAASKSGYKTQYSALSKTVSVK